MPEQKKDNRGGRRLGAGRPKGEKKKSMQVPVWVTYSDIDRLIAELKAKRAAQQTNEEETCETA